MDEIEGLLAATLGADDHIRRAAEQRLQECRTIPGFTRALAATALDLQRPVALRQLAAVLLKQFLSPDMVSAVCDAEIEEIKALILQGLSDPSSKIRTAVSMVISQLVWTSKRRGEDWPALLLRLYQGMTGTDERDVYGCCKCLYMVCEELPHSDAYNLLPTIAPTIFSIVGNTNLRCRTRMRAASVMLSCFNAAALEKGEDHGTRKVREAITDIVRHWLQICQQVFSTLSVEAPEFRLPIKLITTVIVLLREFPKVGGESAFDRLIDALGTTTRQLGGHPIVHNHHMKILKDQVGGLFHVICNFLRNAASVYETSVLRGRLDDGGIEAAAASSTSSTTTTPPSLTHPPAAAEEEDAGVTSDSESVSLEPMVIESLDFLKAVLDCHIGKVAKLMLRAARMPDFLLLMVRYMQMKDIDVFKAEHDANEYMADDDEACRSTARNSAMDLLEDLAELSPMETVSCLVVTVRALVHDLKCGRGAADPCRLQEACIFALGAVSAPVMEEYHRVESLSVVKMTEKSKVLNSTGLKGFVMEAIGHSCGCDSVLLRLRGIWLATQYLDIIEQPAKLQLTQGCVDSMNPSQPLVFRLFSCRALAALLPSLTTTTTYQPVHHLLPRLLDHLAPLLGLTTSDTISQIAETLSAVARVLRTHVDTCSSINESSEPIKVITMVLEVWARYPADSLTVEMGCDALLALLEGCADEPSLACIARALLAHMFKVVEAGLGVYGVCVLSTAIEVLEQTVRKMAPSFRRDQQVDTQPPPTEIERELCDFFPLLIQFLTSASDDELLVRGVALLRVMVRCCPLEEWTYPAWGLLNGLDLLVDFLGKAFAKEEEAGVRIVGVLISEIISHRGQYIQDKVVEGMLTAVLGRLRAAESDELAHQLILIFVRLTLVSVTAVVSFLKRHEVMEQFLKSWLSMHAKLGCIRLAKISGMALLRLIEHAVTAEASLCELKVDCGDGNEAPLVPAVLRVVVSTVIDLQEAFEKGAEAGSEAATDYLDPSLYTLEDGEEEEDDDEEEEDEGAVEKSAEEGGRGGGILLDEESRRGQLAAEHLKALGRESRGGRLAMSEVLRLMSGHPHQSSPFVDLDAYQGLVMEAAEDEESEASATDQAGDPLATIDLKEALHEFMVRSRWMCAGSQQEMGPMFACMGTHERRFLDGMLFDMTNDGSQ